MTSRVFDMIGMSEQSAREREEYIIMRELALTAGRTVGVAAYLLVLPAYHFSTQAVVWLLFGVGIVPIAAWLLMSPLLERRVAPH
jgi:YQGE family putative transporter